MSVPLILSDLERRDAKGQTYPEDLHNYAPTVWPRMTKFAVVTLVGKRHERTLYIKAEGHSAQSAHLEQRQSKLQYADPMIRS